MKRSDYLKGLQNLHQGASRLAEPATPADEDRLPWHADMSFDEIRRAIQQGVPPGSRDPGGCVTVPTGYLSWMAKQARQEAQQRTIEAPVDPEARRKEIEAQIEAWLDSLGHRMEPGRRDLRQKAELLLSNLGVL